MRHTIIIAAASSLLAFASTGIAQEHKPKSEAKAKAKATGHGARLKEMGLSDAQIKQLKTLHFELKSEEIDRQATAKKAQLKLSMLMADNSADSARVLAAFDANAKAHVALKRLDLEGLTKARALLGRELADKLHAMHGKGKGKAGMGKGHPGMGKGHPGMGKGHPGMGKGHPGMSKGHGKGHPGMSKGHGKGHPGMGKGHGKGHPGMGKGHGKGHPGMGHCSGKGHPGMGKGHGKGHPGMGHCSGKGMGHCTHGGGHMRGRRGAERRVRGPGGLLRLLRNLLGRRHGGDRSRGQHGHHGRTSHPGGCLRHESHKGPTSRPHGPRKGPTSRPHNQHHRFGNQRESGTFFF